MTDPRLEAEITSDEQMERWQKGESIHSTKTGECCPDFSCCKPENLAPQDERDAFVEHPETRDSMLMTFLGRAIADYNVHIAGDPSNYEREQ